MHAVISFTRAKRPAALLAGLVAAFLAAAVTQSAMARTDAPDPGVEGLAPKASAMPATLRHAVSVDDVYVRLGDLFDNAGPRAETPVAYAPEPGKRSVFDARWLFAVARGYGVNWRPVSVHDRVMVERPSQIIEADTILAEVRDALIAQGLAEDAEIEVTNRNLRIHIATDSTSDVAVRELAFDARSKRFNAVLEVPAGTPDARLVRVSGRAFDVTEIPVLRRNINRGAVIRESDLRWKQVRVDRVRQDTVTEAHLLVGMAPRRQVRADTPLRASDVAPPVLVERNNLVTIVLKTPVMTLTAQGRALEAGSEGDVIQVMNTSSRQTVQATVEAHNMVSVRPGSGDLAALRQ